MQFSDAAEEKTVFCHRVINAGAAENQPVHATELGKHDGCGHQEASGCAKHLRHDSSSDTILGRVLYTALQDGCAIGCAVQGQHVQINEVTNDVERDDHARA